MRVWALFLSPLLKPEKSFSSLCLGFMVEGMGKKSMLLEMGFLSPSLHIFREDSPKPQPKERHPFAKEVSESVGR